MDPDEWAVARISELQAVGEDCELILRPEGRAVFIYGIRRKDGTIERPPAFCTCGANNPNPATTPDPKLAWRHMSHCPHSERR